MSRKIKKPKSLSPIIILIVLFTTAYYLIRGKDFNEINQTQFESLIAKDSKSEFSDVVIKPKDNFIEVNGVVVDDAGKKTAFSTLYPNTDTQYKYLVDQINSKLAKGSKGIKIVQDSGFSLSRIIWQVFLFFGPFLIIMWILNKNGPGRGMEFGKSKAKLQKDSTTTFKNIAAAIEEKEELQEIVDFLKQPNEYTKLGARIPKGVLLVGPPGTGKTLLAKGVAGEARVPFYTISGSDFVEMFVGVGASRVRSMFKEAKANSPCIIFIDEIDAVGRHRGSGLGGGHDEREQTLNQLLVEMDGFGNNSGIIIIAATNREDVLDPALTRPGRFDRKITVHLPDVKARSQILELHAKNKKFISGIDFNNLARRTPGFSGADLENVLNEASLLSVRDNTKKITMYHLDEAIDRVIGGPAKHSKERNEKDARLVAYHEAGHAIIGLKLADAEVVQKVTIIPRGAAGGYVLMTPKKESFIQTKRQLIHKITSYVGGRISEEIHFGKDQITTGARDDLKKATAIARRMITEFGMSEKIGPIQIESGSHPIFVGREFGQHNDNKFGAELAKLIDEEVKSLIDNASKVARKIINEHKDTVELIAKSLIEHETLTAEMIENIDKYGSVHAPVVKPQIEKTAPKPETTLPKENVEVKKEVKTARQGTIGFDDKNQ